MNKGYKKATAKKSVLKNHVDDERTKLIPSDAQIQNAKTARVYVFGDDDVDEDEINNDELELPVMRPRRGRQTGKGPSGTSTTPSHQDTSGVEIIERPISEGDTLQSIALKYRVQVAELKRVNNLIRDQDFYALQVIKVPIRAHGLILEILEQEEQQKQASSAATNGPSKLPASSARGDDLELVPNDTYGSETDYDLNSETEEIKNQLVVRTLSIRDSFGKDSQSKEAQDFLCRMDADINRIVSSTVSRKDNLEAVTSTLTCKRIQPMQKKTVMWGADCGIRWWSMVAFMLLIGLLTPIIIFILYEASHHDNNSQTTGNGTMTTPSPTHGR